MANNILNGNERITVKAQFKFKASNNDELSLKKGEIITVTQREDGGWWEGTSRETGKTGWFPSNYVSEIKENTPINDTANVTGASIDPTTAAELLAQQIENRQQVIRDLIEKENDFVEEMSNLYRIYLSPLERADIMPMIEYKQLVGNVEELIEAHRNLAHNLNEENPSKKSPREQKVGKILLAHGVNIKSVHLTYWSNHPKAVSILEKYRDSLDIFMENQGAPTPGLMTLTTGLSKPFRQLEKYASVSLELEQHMEDDHVDRGDCQRSVGYYKNVAGECAKNRRQKELELEIMTSTIRNWEGEELCNLGEIVHLGPVHVGAEHKDRYFVLFPSTLLILSVSARMSGFIYEGKLPLSGIAVNRLEDTENVKNSYEITGPMIERIVVSCPTRTESLRWVEILRQQIKCARTSVALSQNHQHMPLPPPHVSPPFLLLTSWIRTAIENGRLTLQTVKDLTQDPPLASIPLFPWQFRRYRNEILLEESENPYGYIRYISNSEDDEITILLPSPVVSNLPSEEESEFEHISEVVKTNNLGAFPSRTQSLKSEIYENSNKRFTSCPPGGISDRNSSFIFIDKTPSQDSLALPYCPPVQVNFQDFSNISSDGEKDQSLVILPYHCQRPIASPIFPLRKSDAFCKTYKTTREIEIKPPDQKRFRVEIQSVINPPKKCDFSIVQDQHQQFKNGFYAHWWMKADLKN